MRSNFHREASPAIFQLKYNIEASRNFLLGDPSILSTPFCRSGSSSGCPYSVVSATKATLNLDFTTAARIYGVPETWKKRGELDQFERGQTFELARKTAWNTLRKP